MIGTSNMDAISTFKSKPRLLRSFFFIGVILCGFALVLLALPVLYHFDSTNGAGYYILTLFVFAIWYTGYFTQWLVSNSSLTISQKGLVIKTRRQVKMNLTWGEIASISIYQKRIRGRGVLFIGQQLIVTAREGHSESVNSFEIQNFKELIRCLGIVEQEHGVKISNRYSTKETSYVLLFLTVICWLMFLMMAHGLLLSPKSGIYLPGRL